MEKQQLSGAVPVFSICSSADFLDIPLPMGCPQIRCQSSTTRPHRQSRDASEPVPKEADLRQLLESWEPSERLKQRTKVPEDSEVGVQCYLHGMLVSFADMLCYSP